MEEQGNLNPKYFKIEVEVKVGAITKEIIRIGIGQTIDQTVGIEDCSCKKEVDIDLSKVIEEIISEIIPEDTVDKTAEESMGIIVIEMATMTEVGIGLGKDHSQEIMAVTELGVQAIVD